MREKLSASPKHIGTSDAAPGSCLDLGAAVAGEEEQGARTYVSQNSTCFAVS